jgi:hypothetical protein
MEGKRQRGDT